MPVTVTTVAVVWGVYWGIVFVFRESLIALSYSRFQFAINLSQIGSNLFGALTMLAELMVQSVTFYRITKLFRIVRATARSCAVNRQALPEGDSA